MVFHCFISRCFEVLLEAPRKEYRWSFPERRGAGVHEEGPKQMSGDHDPHDGVVVLRGGEDGERAVRSGGRG